MTETNKDLENKKQTHSAYKFIILIGLVSLFADMTYQGARSIIGPYLAILGATAATVGFVAGFGELIGYVLRYVSGVIADKTKQYWILTILGYGVNLIAFPLLAFINSWEVAAFLIILERFGKALRVPARDAMLSYATQHVGSGKGFGLHKFIDQIGAISGPLLMSLVLFLKGDYEVGFLFLFIPAFISMIILFYARFQFPQPANLESKQPEYELKGYSKNFWIYLIAVSFIAAGFIDFPLIAYNFKKLSLGSDIWIPCLYALAMSIGAFSALLFGRLFDIIGFKTLIIATILSLPFAILTFSNNFTFVLIGMLLWGLGLGAQESVMKAAVAIMVSKDKRGSAFGLFNSMFGISWFIGSAAIGLLYDISVFYAIILSVSLQIIAIPIFFLIKESK